jgi:S1-C subfamily serine protease
MIFRIFAAVLCAMALSGSAIAEPAWLPGNTPAQSRSIKLARIVIDIKRGEKIGRAKYAIYGLLCLYPDDLLWKTRESLDLKVELFDSMFRDTMGGLGFVVAGDPKNLFGQLETDNVEYLVGGSIDHMDMQVCYRDVDSNGVDYERSTGSGSVDVTWQVYSNLERKVVAVIKTSGKAVRPQAQGGGAFGLIFDAFDDATRQLASSREFSELMTKLPARSGVARTPPPGLVSLQLQGAQIGNRSLADAVASTAVIFANGGEGSGFLVSKDGFLLTNHHVVGGAQFVKVKWADGVEVLGEVIRSDKLRDVALVKVDVGTHKPLVLRNDPVVVGEDIYAIGAPTGEKFRNTVTKGIVSATRVFNDHNFIQSDVAVTHGNSGGPIVDAKGQVVGLTDLGFGDAPMVNLFIPITEALGFLGLQMAPPK